MQYNLTDVFTGKKKQVNETLSLELDAISIYGDVHEFLDGSDVSLKASYMEDGKADIEATYHCKVELPCDRCLKPVIKSIDVDYKGVALGPELRDESSDEDDFMTDYSLDIDALILSEIMMNWPSKILCREDCKGICSVCGHDLNEGECGCDRFVPNPAFAGLKDLFKNE